MTLDPIRAAVRRLYDTTPPTDTLPLPLPDVPGRAHGIVSLDPPTVQCDGCCATYTGRTLARAVLGSGFHFNPALYPGDKRRLCRDCAKEAGWDR